MTKKDIAWPFAVIVLSVLLVTSVILGVTGYFSSVTYLNSKSDLVVGENISIGVLPNQTSVVSLTFDGSYLQNQSIPQVIQINAQDLNTDINVRVKAKIFGEIGDFKFVTTSHFEEKEDGYFYFDDVLKGGNKITFCNYLITPEGDYVDGEKYILSIIVETIESKYSSEVWNLL